MKQINHVQQNTLIVHAFIPTIAINRLVLLQLHSFLRSPIWESLEVFINMKPVKS